jgi:hypothetical protein
VQRVSRFGVPAQLIAIQSHSKTKEWLFLPMDKAVSSSYREKPNLLWASNHFVVPE